ncbi:ribosome small subunit-dependent GTPase A [Brachybacterium halotolerans subsp. kimchii]|uniref:ribosome small subunit-dependent GTPase A n=1 Tax=Brachybacterium halotolerans TaxID=2795215 RepID=UPI001E4F5FD8|nr:ribosome small subunit-dependent GTPase A [Brachybacterium halotolerans]UEJ82845.1 ribosome small subunit-dependent GTPase A [Brachybacterium halotolerans subsp. kimchii]
MSRRIRDLDESDVRIRPNRRGSRPRTKIRPSHDDAVPAFVTAVDRGRWRTVVGSGTTDEHVVTAMRARELGRTPIVPGDVVGLVGDTSGREGSLARIVKVHERSSFLRRSADDDDPTERPLVANADLMVIVTALADPEPRGGMIDRCLVAAWVAGIDALLCLTKSDLRDPAGFLAQYAPLGVEHVVTHLDEAGRVVGVEELAAHLHGRTSVLIGHSGVGKSTLLNALVPGADRATGHVNDVTGRGRHTSSSALALRLPDQSGWVIDTPGVRSFGLGHVSPEELLEAFADLAPLAEECPRGCTHAADAPDCALDAAVEEGRAGSAGPERLASYRRLDEALRRNDPWEA